MTDLKERIAGLLPCPFCGAEAHVGGADKERKFYVSCDAIDCYACVGEAYDRDAMPDHCFASEADAITAWNRRAPDPRIAALEQRIAEVTERDQRLMTKLGTFRPTGNVELDACLQQPDAEWEAFKATLPETYWARYDISAVRLGWHYGLAARAVGA